MYRIECDRCGHLAEEEEKDAMGYLSLLVDTKKSYHLCPACVQSVERWLAHPSDDLPDPMPPETLFGPKAWDGTWRWPWRKKRRQPE